MAALGLSKRGLILRWSPGLLQGVKYLLQFTSFSFLLSEAEMIACPFLRTAEAPCTGWRRDLNGFRRRRNLHHQGIVGAPPRSSDHHLPASSSRPAPRFSSREQLAFQSC